MEDAAFEYESFFSANRLRRDGSLFFGKIVERVSEQAGGVPVPTDRRLFPLKRLPAEIRRDQAVAAEAFMDVMLRENGAAEIPEHRKATLMGQRISADVMAVRREDTETDVVAAKQRFA